MFNLRRVLAVLILIVVLVLGIVIWRHTQQLSPVEALEALPRQVELSLDKLHYTQNEEGKRSWTLDADKAEYQRENNMAVLDVVRLTLYEAGQFGEVKLTADHGQLDQEQRQVEVWGQVVVITGNGECLYTERLLFDGEQRLIRTAEPVRMVSPKMELRGTGMQVDLNRGNLLLEKDVWMFLLPEERKE